MSGQAITKPTIHTKVLLCHGKSYPTQPHYITENIVNGFLVGYILFYYGSKTDVIDVFNPKAFVFDDIDYPIPALNQLREVYENFARYNELLQDEPVLTHGQETVREQHLSYVDEIEGEVKYKLRAVMEVLDEQLMKGHS